MNTRLHFSKQVLWIFQLVAYKFTFVPGSVLPPECPPGITSVTDPYTERGSVNLTHGGVTGELMLPAGLYSFKAVVEDRNCSVDVKVYGEWLRPKTGGEGGISGSCLHIVYHEL